MTTLRKETPVRDLPRCGIDPAVLAERQGFDDGYFGNPYQNLIGTHFGKRSAAYARGFDQGQKQRESADKRSAKRK